jgi:hypothetical protein
MLSTITVPQRGHVALHSRALSPKQLNAVRARPLLWRRSGPPTSIRSTRFTTPQAARTVYQNGRACVAD